MCEDEDDRDTIPTGPPPADSKKDIDDEWLFDPWEAWEPIEVSYPVTEPSSNKISLPTDASDVSDLRALEAWFQTIVDLYDAQDANPGRM